MSVSFGHFPRGRFVNGAARGVTAERADRNGVIADFERGDVRADFAHDAAGLIADDVRLRHQRAAGAIQHVAAFDADGFHVDDDAVRVARRIGDVLVTEHLRCAVFIVDCGLHLDFVPERLRGWQR